MSVDQGYATADQIHQRGQAIVWSGPKEQAELYWQQLEARGLTMAPLGSCAVSFDNRTKPPVPALNSSSR